MRNTQKTLVLALAATLALALLVAPTVAAKLPPSGKYGCTLITPDPEEPDQYLGDLRIRGTEYKVNKSRWGKMANPRGNRIKFKTGAWKGLFRGTWERGVSSYGPYVEIELTEIKSGYESSYCSKES